MQLASLHLINLMEYAACKGIDPKELYHLVDIPESALTDSQGSVGLDTYCRVWERMMVLSGDAHVGLHYGCFLNLKALGLIYQISLATSSIEQALGLLEAYLISTFPLVHLVTGVSNAHFYVELHSHIPDNLMKNQVLDSVLFLMYREINLMINGEIDLVQLPYSDLQPYQRVCASKVAQADAHRLLLDRRQISGEINRRRIKNIELLLPVFLQLTSQSNIESGSFSEQVTLMTLSLCSPELPVLDDVVAQFAMSQRTFQRKLTGEGYSFRAICDDIKRQISLHLERGKTLKTQDIALILGYSEPSAYLHAVRKWRTRQNAKALSA